MKIDEVKRKLEKDQKALDVMKEIVRIVEPLSPVKRDRVIRAAAILHGIKL